MKLNWKNNKQTLLMGILNVTPDSFYGNRVYADPGAAIAQAKIMEKDGANIIDVGGESTRPGSNPVSVEEEIERVVPVIEGLTKTLRIPISADTYKPEVAEKALEAGAEVVNDIFAIRQEGMAEIIAKHNVPVVMMHMQGTPKNMQENPSYSDVISEIKSFFAERIEFAISKGISKDNIIIDPGIGFGKTTEHNLQIIKNLEEFKSLGCPILIGPSRKSFIGNTLSLQPTDRLEGTIASVVLSVANGVDMVRVHDIGENLRAIRMAEAILKA